MAHQVEGNETNRNNLFCSTQNQYPNVPLEVKQKDFLSIVTLEAPLFEETKRASLDIVAVLDVSGSMRGDKISLVRKTMRRLVRELGKNDRVAIVTFSTRVKVLLDWTSMDDKGKIIARNKIQKLTDDASTNLCGGLTKGIKMLLGSRVNEVGAVVLLTDGEANEGIQNEQKILEELNKVTNRLPKIEVTKWTKELVGRWIQTLDFGAANFGQAYCKSFIDHGIDGNALLSEKLTDKHLEQDLGVKPFHVPKIRESIKNLTKEGGTKSPGQSQIQIHTFGYGVGHQASLLEKISVNFEGFYCFIQKEQDIKNGFATCLGGLLATVAQDITLTFSSNYKDFKVLGSLATRNQNGGFVVKYNDLQSEERRDIVVSVDLPSHVKKKKIEIAQEAPAFRIVINQEKEEVKVEPELEIKEIKQPNEKVVIAEPAVEEQKEDQIEEKVVIAKPAVEEQKEERKEDAVEESFEVMVEKEVVPGSQDVKEIVGEQAPLKKKEAEVIDQIFDCVISYRNILSGVVVSERVKGVVQRFGKETGEGSLIVDKNYNRILCSKGLKRAEQLADRSKLKEAREHIVKIIKIIEKSISAKDMENILLVKDLNETLEGLKSRATYRAVGQSTMTTNHYSMRSQRCVTTSFQYKSISQTYSRKSHRTMTTRFEKGDEDDSD